MWQTDECVKSAQTLQLFICSDLKISDGPDVSWVPIKSFILESGACWVRFKTYDTLSACFFCFFLFIYLWIKLIANRIASLAPLSLSLEIASMLCNHMIWPTVSPSRLNRQTFQASHFYIACGATAEILKRTQVIFESSQMANSETRCCATLRLFIHYSCGVSSAETCFHMRGCYVSPVLLTESDPIRWLLWFWVGVFFAPFVIINYFL